MPYLTRNEIEVIARRVVTAYLKLPTHKGEMVTTVDPELLAKEVLGLNVECHRLSLTGNIHGLTVFGKVAVAIYDDPEHSDYYFLDGKTILIEKELQENSAKIGRYHFTIAHEASHQIYKMLYPKEYLGNTYYRKIHYYTDSSFRSSDKWDEWRTNALAAAILMPADMLRLNMVDFGLGERLQSIHRADRNYTNFIRLACLMGVSTQALAIRMKQLELLGSYYLGNPTDLITAVVGDDEIDGIKEWRKHWREST